MIYVTGDMHGDYSVFAGRRIDRLKKDDILLVTGDFGFIWNDSAEEIKNLKKLQKKKYKIIFVEGAHENFERIRQYPENELYGSTAFQISENIFCLKRGEVYTIDDKSILALGGGLSPQDDEPQKPIMLPDDEDLQRAVDNLQDRHRRIDVIITHEAPASIKRLIVRNAAVNDLNLFLDTVLHNTRYGKWYFGSLHEDRVISEKLVCVYEDVIAI